MVASLEVNVRWGPGGLRRVNPPPLKRVWDKVLFAETKRPVAMYKVPYSLQSEISFTV